jgi:hypothetical protein
VNRKPEPVWRTLVKVTRDLLPAHHEIVVIVAVNSIYRSTSLPCRISSAAYAAA